MKYLILSFLVIVTGCDTPTRSRFPSTNSGGNALNDSGIPFTPVNPTSGSTTGTTGGGTTSPGFQNCNLTTRSYTADLGNIGVCKSSVDETQIRFVSSLTNTSVRTCLIPTYKDQYGNSTYLGDPQCTFTETEKIYGGNLYKTRQGFSGYPITGVMVMKENLLLEYFACMDSYQKYIQNYCPAAPTYAPCVQAATNYRNSICNSFKLKYPSNYLDLSLR